MSFDALTLAAVRDELEPLLSAARVQKLVFVDELSLAIEVFAPGAGRTNLLLSADPTHSRVQCIAALPARGIDTESPFSLVARKHLRSARIRAVRQPRLERVLELDCEQRDASGQQVRVTVIVEAMGRRSNLVLVDDERTIIDAARRTPPSRNPRRPVLPHLPYQLPPPQARLFPEQLDMLPDLAGGGDQSLARFVAEHVAGLSPVAAREAVFRATGTLDTPIAAADWPRLIDRLRSFVAAPDWRPSVAFDETDAPVEYAPFELTHLAAGGARVQPYDSISAAMDAYYARPTRRGDALAAERKALLAPIERTIGSTERRVAALEHQLASGEEVREPLRGAGELILTHQASLAPKASALDVDGEHIELDPDLTPSQNAQAYFARYRKAREASERVPALLDEARQTLSHLGNLRALVEIADSMDAIRSLRREVGSASGAGRTSRDRTPQKGTHRRVMLGDGWEALVGTSAAGNATVTFDLADATDLWLHARGVPGAHVILRARRAEPPNAILERAAELAAWHSSARTANHVEVDVAPRRYVRKIPDAPPGLVRYSNERTVRVTPRAHG